MSTIPTLVALIHAPSWAQSDDDEALPLGNAQRASAVTKTADDPNTSGTPPKEIQDRRAAAPEGYINGVPTYAMWEMPVMCDNSSAKGEGKTDYTTPDRDGGYTGGKWDLG